MRGEEVLGALGMGVCGREMGRMEVCDARLRSGRTGVSGGTGENWGDGRMVGIRGRAAVDVGVGDMGAVRRCGRGRRAGRGDGGRAILRL